MMPLSNYIVMKRLVLSGIISKGFNSFLFNLTDSFTGEIHLFTDFLEGSFAITVESISHDNNCS